MRVILVTPHAIEMYQARIYAPATDIQAQAELERALQLPLFSVPSKDDKLTLWGCRNRHGFAFVIATDPADDGAPFLLVRTCGPVWWWKEARAPWRAIGQRAGMRGRKHRDRAV